MTSNRPSGKQSPAKSSVGKSAPLPPTSRRSARQQRLASREANRALVRAGTRGSSGGLSNLMVYSLGALVIGVLIIGMAYFATRPSGPPSASASPIPPAADVRTPSDIPQQGHVLGQSGAPVTIDIWGDFRCSACFDFFVSEEHQIIANFVATGQAKLVWHDFLTIDHYQPGVTESRDAAAAAWCAADQNKFWTMHDWLYANQSPTESPGFFTLDRLRAIAEAAGLDMTKYDACMAAGNHVGDVVALQSAIPTGATGTPSIFVNGTIVGQASTVPSYQQIADAINAALGISPSPSVSPTPSATESPSATETSTAGAS
jgi:protein-disulfide isomerase